MWQGSCCRPELCMACFDAISLGVQAMLVPLLLLLLQLLLPCRLQSMLLWLSSRPCCKGMASL